MGDAHLPNQAYATSTGAMAASPLRSLLGTHYRSTRVLVLLAAVCVMSFADLFMTLTYLTGAGMLESNPVARVVMVGSGATGVILWKLLTLSLAGFILFIARHRLSAEAGAIFCCAVLGWLMVHWTVYIDEVHMITPILNGAHCAEALGWVSTAEGMQAGRVITPPRRIVLLSDPWEEP